MLLCLVNDRLVGLGQVLFQMKRVLVIVCQLILDQVELEIVQMKRVLDLFRLVNDGFSQV